MKSSRSFRLSSSDSTVAPRAPRGFGAWLASLLAVAGVACSSGATTSVAPKAEYGQPCKKDSDCGSTDGFALACGVDPQGQPVCVESCAGDYGDSVQYGSSGGNACIQGRMTPCEQLPPATTCGCGCAPGTYCAASADGSSGKCVPALDPGADCQGDVMCKSRLCFSCPPGGSCLGDAISGTCSVPIGSPCTGQSDCPACFTTNGGPSWCSLPCWVSTGAGGIVSNNCPQEYVCLGPSGAQDGNCYEQCKALPGYGLTGTTGCPGGATCQPYAAAGNPTTTGTFESSGYACQ